MNVHVIFSVQRVMMVIIWPKVSSNKSEIAVYIFIKPFFFECCSTLKKIIAALGTMKNVIVHNANVFKIVSVMLVSLMILAM